MRKLRLLVFFLFNVLVLNVSVYSVFAKIPTTSKILFTSVQDDNYKLGGKSRRSEISGRKRGGERK